MASPVLVFGYGNPGRGDDALGPALIERLEALQADHPGWPEAELITDFQLQVEHTLDMQGRELVLFADASLDAPPPYTLVRIRPSKCGSCLSHALAPGEMLRVYENLFGVSAPCFLLAIRGESFELGEPLSAAAIRNLECAARFVSALLETGNAAQRLADAADERPITLAI